MQIHNLYLVTESESGIIIYDQHAVHERIIYEKLINQHKDQKEEANAQGLLTSLIVNLSVQEAEVLKENLEILTNSGFIIEDFGGNSFKITQVPSVLATYDIKTLIHELIEDIDNDGDTKDIDQKSNKILTYLACRSAYKAGDLIPLEEALGLIERLNTTEISYTCPHGRPVKVEITLKELSKMFKRT